MNAAQLALPLSPDEFNRAVLTPALRLLPASMDSQRARVLLIAIALQESRLAHRWQVVAGGGKGPARGLLQFERGTAASRGGVYGVFLHPASAALLRTVCDARGVACEPRAIWQALETDDILAAAVARLLLATDPYPLPSTSDAAGAWELYAKRTWRPGKPHRHTWDAYHLRARAAAGVAASAAPAAPEPSAPAQMPWWRSLIALLAQYLKNRKRSAP